ncbi:MAG: hypothetical protein GJ680_00920 [Alteromonadaceae bacterium]|nr:hypothetical protein [Alteromonadaceae bacterium]
MKHLNKAQLALLVAASLGLAACSDDNDNAVEVVTPAPAPAPTPVLSSYDVTVTNLTNAQPLSPIAVALHAEGQLWQIGAEASEELEYLSEGGDNSFLLANAAVVASASGMGIVAPGASETISVSIEDNSEALITIATMLVNTNDAFTGLNAHSLASLGVGETMTRTTFVYDSGTEANTEAMGTIPGSADGGTGFDAMRDDAGFISMHPGVVGNDDGLSTSVLTQAHRFDNPAMRISITRTE